MQYEIVPVRGYLFLRAAMTLDFDCDAAAR